MTIASPLVSALPAIRATIRTPSAALFPLLLSLSGCASARVTEIHETAAFHACRRILVEIRTSSTTSEPDQATRDAARVVKLTLLNDLKSYSIDAVALPAPVGAVPLVPASVILKVDIAAETGNLWKRLLIGFGFGRSRMLAKVTLVDARRQPATELLEFDVESDSGRAPGLLLPAGVAIEKASVLNFTVGGGTGILFNMRHGPSQDAADASAAIATTLRKYYRHFGWLPSK